MKFSLNLPKNIMFGENSVDALGENVKSFGNICIIVTGKKSTKESGALDKVVCSLKKANIAYMIFDEVVGEPDTEIVDKVRNMAKAEGAKFIIGLGGGSALDVAKAAAGLYGQSLTTLNYLNKEPFEYKGIPFVGIPTTSGTGSEITLNSVLYNKTKGNKNSIAHPEFQSKLSIIDPVLTYSMPKTVTAASGMDALTHAIESYTSKAANPVTFALAGKAIQLIGENIVRAVGNGLDRDARSNMALGSVTAALAFSQTGVGVAHSISHPLGAFFHIPHGVANAILLPVVIDYNDAACHDRYEEIKVLLGGNKKASKQIREFMKNMPIAKTLLEAGYSRGSEKEIIEKTFQSRSLKKNPRVVEEKDILDIIEKCL